jgi:hypothetical protein
MFIKSLGVEIEGAWDELPRAFMSADSRFGHKVYRTDGSVSGFKEMSCHRCGNNKRSCGCGAQRDFDKSDKDDNRFGFVGEIASYPFDNINPLLSWIREYYPDKTNRSCGLHVHLKPINNMIYRKLNSKRFYNDFMSAIEYFGKARTLNADSAFWQRLKGNTYCKKGFTRWNGRDGDRYRAINFCYQKHKTIEFRIWPAFNSKRIAIDAVKFNYDFVNTWLMTHKIIVKPIETEVELENVDI